MTVSQISKFSKIPTEISPRNQASDEKPKNYLTHPTLGLLYSVCQISDHIEIFTTIYAQRFFFLVTSNGTGIKWEAISRQEARLLVEKHLKTSGDSVNSRSTIN